MQLSKSVDYSFLNMNRKLLHFSQKWQTKLLLVKIDSIITFTPGQFHIIIYIICEISSAG